MNKYQLFSLITGSILLLLGFLTKEAGPQIFCVTLGIFSLVMFFFLRSATKKLSQEATHTEIPEAKQITPTKTVSIIPEVLEAKQSTRSNTAPKTFDEKIAELIDRNLDAAKVDVKITLKVPLNRKINYYGKEVPISGDLTMYIDTSQQQKEPKKDPITFTVSQTAHTITEKPIED